MSLNLDARQRAMLREMGVPMWEPAPRVAAAQVPQSHPKPASVSRPARAAQPAPASAALMPTPVAQTVDTSQLDWVALQAAVANCRACALCQRRKHTVFGVGPASASAEQAPQVDWMVVGEGPGEQEDLSGEPFVGPAGQLLDNMLKAIGLQRRGLGGAGVYIANVVKCRPPGNRNPEPAEIAQCAPYLQRQIELLRPRIILAMGRFAAHALLGSVEPLGKLRGQVHHYAGTPVIATYHPAYLLRNLPEKAKAWADLQLARKTLAHLSAPGVDQSLP